MASTSTATAVERAPVDAATHAFVVPQAQLRGEHSLDAWIRSDAASTVLDAVVTLSAAVRGVKIRDVKQTSDVRVPVPSHPLPLVHGPPSDTRRPPSAFARPARPPSAFVRPRGPRPRAVRAARRRAAGHARGMGRRHPAAAGPQAAVREQGLPDVVRPARAGPSFPPVVPARAARGATQLAARVVSPPARGTAGADHRRRPL